MEWTIVVNCLLIVLARITDITLDTVRTVFIVQGRRGWAAMLGFCEALVFIIVVAKVLQNFSHPAYAVAYAAGFAGGTYLGITAEKWLGLGYRVVSIFTREGEVVASALRETGICVTIFDGAGRDGPVNLLYIQVPRKQASRVIALARSHDAECYTVVNDVLVASHGRMHARLRGIV